MLYSVKGTLLCAEPRMAVVECGGVGFRCQITMNTARQLPSVGSETMLYTIMNVREDAIELFGFAERSELNCFKQLTAITAWGPRWPLPFCPSCPRNGWRWRWPAGTTSPSPGHRVWDRSWPSAS